MPIIDLQRRIREVGRIRLGVQETSARGKRYPRKLDTFRFTSKDRAVVEATATLYGGTVEAWDNDGASEWENISTVNAVPVALQPAGMGFDQWYEQYAKGYCTARCDGVRNIQRDEPCSCDPADRACQTVTRLSLFLSDVPGLGVWRVESHGWYAAGELAGMVRLLGEVAGAGVIVPATLRLEWRTLKRLVNGKAEKREFAVPCLDVGASFAQVRAGLAAGPHGTALAAPEAPALGPAPQVVVERAEPAGWKPVAPPTAEEVGRGFVSVEDQVAETEAARPPRPRKNAAKALSRAVAPPGAGGPPRLTCTVCGQPYGSEGGLVPNPAKGPGDSRFIHAAHLEEPASAAPAPADGPAEASASQGSLEGPGGTDGDGMRSAAEPARAHPGPRLPAQATAMSNLQRGKLFALANEVWPDDGQSTAGEMNQRRHDRTLALCAALGSPGLQSRSDIDRVLAGEVIDALVAMLNGDLVLSDDGRLEPAP